MVNPRSSGFLTLLDMRVCRIVPMYLGTYIEREKYNVTHWTYFKEIYPNFIVYTQSIVSILVCIYPVTSKSHQMPLIMLSLPFDVIIQPFVSRHFTNSSIKCERYSSPCLIQVCVLRCTVTNNCDSVPSFHVIVLQLYDQRLVIFNIRPSSIRTKM